MMTAWQLLPPLGRVILQVGVMQKLLSTFTNMDTVQGYDGAQSIASIPGKARCKC